MRRHAVFIVLVAFGLIVPLVGGAAVPARAQEATPGADCPQTTEAENQAIVERWYRSIETSDWDGVRAVFAPGATQDAADFTDAAGVEAIVGSMKGFVSAFPDLHHEIEMWVLDDDLVAARVVGTGTHLGEFQGIAPTGNEISWTIIPIYRIACGQIVAHWTEVSAFNRLVALGAVDNPLAAGSPAAAPAASPETASPEMAPLASPAAACPTTSEEENMALIERWYDEIWTQGNVENINDFLVPDQDHHRVMDRFNSGAEARVATIQRWRQAFPDLEEHADLLLADGDFVVARKTAAGTHQGTWEGVVPATGNRVEWTVNTIFRFECGKIAEEWSEADALSFFNQLGVIDWPQQPPAAPQE